MGTVPSPNIVGAVDAGQNIFANRLAEYQRMAQLQQQMGIEKQQAQQQAEAFPLQQQQREQAVRQAQIQNQAMQQQADQQKQAATLQPKFVTRDENGKVTGFDNEGYENALTEAGLGQLAIAHQTQRADAVSKLAAADKTTRDKIKDIHQGMYERLEGIKGITDPAERQQHYLSSLRWAQQNGVDVGQWPTQAPSNDQLTHFEGDLGMSGQLLADADKQADIKKKNADAARVGHVPGVDLPFSPEVQKQKISIASAQAQARANAQAAAGGGGDDTAATPVDPNSGSILAQTGLSLNGFRVLTGAASQLPRDRFTRNKASAEAQKWANEHGIDISTMPSQYKALNDVLSSNVSRLNQTKIMENELDGTIQNLKQVANEKDLGRLNFANVAKIWAGQNINDPIAQRYAVHLYQLRNELAAYGAATQGRSGNNITLQDTNEAEKTIKNGISSGSLDGLERAVKDSTDKMGTVMQNSVDRARRGVWDLFGVGEHYKPQAGSSSSSGSASKFSVKAPNGKTYMFKDQKSLDAFKQAANIP